MGFLDKFEKWVEKMDDKLDELMKEEKVEHRYTKSELLELHTDNWENKYYNKMLDSVRRVNSKVMQLKFINTKTGCKTISECDGGIYKIILKGSDITGVDEYGSNVAWFKFEIAIYTDEYGKSIPNYPNMFRLFKEF